VQTIVFAPGRMRVELLLTYLREALRSKPGDGERVAGYRGGYLPKKRREIEAGLREGTVLGVVSTNALELGIDIGALDVSVVSGYPGTIASTWQQAGRAGRRTGASVAIFIANSNPLNQFVVNHPDYFFSGSPEHGLVNPDNLSILVDHVKCAAFELPFEDGSLDFAYSLGVLHHVPDTPGAVEGVARTLKRGAPLLLYLYYAFDNRPFWYRSLWKITDGTRRLITRLPLGAKSLVCDSIAAGVYWPLARIALAANAAGIDVSNFPLALYRNRSFYTMRTDARDRFGTPLEKRFYADEIRQMMLDAGLTDIRFSDVPPF